MSTIGKIVQIATTVGRGVHGEPALIMHALDENGILWRKTECVNAVDAWFPVNLSTPPLPGGPLGTVNNYEYGIYQDGEVFIQTTPDQMRANDGKVYLTYGELLSLLSLIS